MLTKEMQEEINCRIFDFLSNLNRHLTHLPLKEQQLAFKTGLDAMYRLYEEASKILENLRRQNENKI
jgi:hypothetical protein